jgi:hypothetical protein
LRKNLSSFSRSDDSLRGAEEGKNASGNSEGYGDVPKEKVPDEMLFYDRKISFLKEKDKSLHSF